MIRFFCLKCLYVAVSRSFMNRAFARGEECRTAVIRSLRDSK